MRMNRHTELIFALEHVSHLEDYITKVNPLIHPLTTIKIELEKELKQHRRRRNGT